MHRRSFLVSQSLVVDTNKTDFVSNYVHISYSYIKVISTYIARRRKVLSLYRLIKVIVIFYVIVRFL